MRKHKGTTNDTRGCQFHYTCLVSEGYKVYFCNEFPEVEAGTLKELKIKMGKK